MRVRRIVVDPAAIGPSHMTYYYPPTIMDDFTKFIHTDIPHATYTFEVVHDWYARGVEGYEP